MWSPIRSSYRHTDVSGSTRVTVAGSVATWAISSANRLALSLSISASAVITAVALSASLRTNASSAACRFFWTSAASLLRSMRGSSEQAGVELVDLGVGGDHRGRAVGE